MGNTQTISSLSIVFMSVSAFLAIAVPIGAIIFMGVRKRLKVKALLVGTAMFIAFAMILESILHRVVLGSNPTTSPLYGNLILYMLYGGFAAGIFEETARLLGFKFLIRIKEDERLETGIAYGIGHGGIEALLLGGMVSVSNIVTSVMWNSGLLKGTTAAMNEQQLQSFNAGITALATAQSGMFLMNGVERLIAFTLQVALSLLVFKAVREKKWQYFLYAVLLHAGIDMPAVMIQRGVFTNIYLFEAVFAVLTIGVFVFSLSVNKRRGNPEEPELL